MTHLKALRLAAEKATQGEWFNDGIDTFDGCKISTKGRYGYVDICRIPWGFDMNEELQKEQEANAEFITLARNHIIPLLDRVEKLEGALRDVKVIGEINLAPDHDTRMTVERLIGIATEALKENTDG